MKKQHLQFTATCARGVENLVAAELADFGCENISITTGAVLWSGALETALRGCLWSRFASRILHQLTVFEVKDADALYTDASAFAWEEVFPLSATFAINTTLSGATRIKDNRYAGLKLKDAIVDHFRSCCGERPSVQAKRPGIQFHLHIEADGETDRARVYLDLSGDSLHRRGYRVSSTIAPLKETLAAAIVALSDWRIGEEALVDPMCGSGTILIEAAMMAGDVAPGISRCWFGFFAWKGHDQTLWDQLVDEAVRREEEGMNRPWPLFLGYDADPLAVAAARRNIARAGLEERIRIRQAELATVASPAAEGTLISNLPFGERLLEEEVVARLYRAVGRLCSSRFHRWRLAVFISNPELGDSFDLRWEKRVRLFNGPLSCRLFVTSLCGQQEKPFVWSLPEAPEPVPEAEDFINRLRKNDTKMRRWAAKQGVSCYRLYDRDLPEYNLALDLYDRWFHLQEYAASGKVSEETAAERIRLAVAGIQSLFGVRRERIFVKRRQRQRGRDQYQRRSGRTQQRRIKYVEVREGAANLLVNFTDYLDTGLFLDHRLLRHRLFLDAAGCRFLNLFGYTGSATVSAALGGAAETTTVDLSATYLAWARKNLALNGFAELRHKFVRADCIAWLEQCSSRYDLILLDPPTFSNTHKKRRTFDIQRDHPRLLQLAMSRLERGGLLLFSTNFRKFRLDEGLECQYDVHEISSATVPFDFQRNPRIHRCWEFRLNGRHDRCRPGGRKPAC